MLLRKAWVRNGIIGLTCLGFLGVLYGMRSVLSPLFFALAMAYVLDPVIDRFESWKISRTWGIVILCAIITLVVLAFALYLIPRLIHEIEALAKTLPGYWETFEKRFLVTPEGDTAPVVLKYKTEAITWFNENQDKLVEWVQVHGGKLLGSLTSGVASSFRSIGVFVGNLLGLVIIPVLAFYLLRDFDIMTSKLGRLVPLQHKAAVFDLFRELDGTMSNFIKGQLLVALLLSIIYTIGLEIANCPASLLIGVIAGFANLIPYLGIALGLVPALLLTYLSGNPTWQIVFAGSTFVVGQMLEGMVITPKVVGESVGLHPVVVLIGLMIGGTYFGFVGMILALPCTAILMVLLKRAHKIYVESSLYDGEKDKTPSKEPETAES